jgi:hypothetical protein
MQFKLIYLKNLENPCRGKFGKLKRFNREFSLALLNRGHEKGSPQQCCVYGYKIIRIYYRILIRKHSPWKLIKAPIRIRPPTLDFSDLFSLTTLNSVQIRPKTVQE